MGIKPGCGSLHVSENPRSVVVKCPERPESGLRAKPGIADLRAKVERAAGWSFFSPVDIAPLVFFRIAFGALMFVEVIGNAVMGFVRDNWIRPEMHFTYFGFGWISAPPGNWMYGL